MILFTTFDIADQSFSFYTEDEWISFMSDIREELSNDLWLGDKEIVANMDWHELLESYYGEELFWDSVDTNNVKN